MSDLIETSIIVPTFNGEGKIGRLIDLLLPLMSPSRELIVIDDGSEDGTAAMLDGRLANHPRARWCSINNRGRSGARNFGASWARGSLIVFLDDDIEVSSNFLDRMEQIYHRLPSAWITGTVRQKIADLPHADFLRFRTKLDYDIDGQRSVDGLVRTESFTTQLLGVSRRVFLRLGGFREGLRDGEDFELSVRAGDAGYTIIHDTMNIVLHADFADFDSFLCRQKAYYHGRAVLREQMPEFVDRFPILFAQPRRGLSERVVRRIFVYNSFWRTFLKSRLRHILPEPTRHKLYDYVLSSTIISVAEEMKYSQGSEKF